MKSSYNRQRMHYPAYHPTKKNAFVRVFRGKVFQCTMIGSILVSGRNLILFALPHEFRFISFTAYKFNAFNSNNVVVGLKYMQSFQWNKSFHIPVLLFPCLILIKHPASLFAHDHKEHMRLNMFIQYRQQGTFLFTPQRTHTHTKKRERERECTYAGEAFIEMINENINTYYALALTTTSLNNEKQTQEVFQGTLAVGQGQSYIKNGVK